MNENQKIMVAKEILKAAADLAAAEKLQIATHVTAEVTPELEKTAKEVEGLANKFKDAHKGLIEELKQAEDDFKEKAALLSSYYKDWQRSSGYAAARKALLAQAQTCLEVGDSLEGVVDSIQVLKKESTQESYKEKYNILVSMLNAAELAKYTRILDSFFAKQITALKTGVDVLDKDSKEWHESAQEIAKERGIKLPTASKMASAMDNLRKRDAGLMQTLMDTIKDAIPSLVQMVKNWGKRFYNIIMRNGEELEDLAADVSSMAMKVKKVVN